MIQTEFDFTARIENNSESQAILNSNSSRINGQCRTVYEALLRGERLTTTYALIHYGIGDLRRRIKDLRDYAGVNIQSRLLENRFKEYYL